MTFQLFVDLWLLVYTVGGIIVLVWGTREAIKLSKKLDKGGR
jgi:hypothetical protein